MVRLVGQGQTQDKNLRLVGCFDSQAGKSVLWFERSPLTPFCVETCLGCFGGKGA